MSLFIEHAQRELPHILEQYLQGHFASTAHQASQPPFDPGQVARSMEEIDPILTALECADKNHSVYELMLRMYQVKFAMAYDSTITYELSGSRADE